ncbi:MAG: lipopolysaccharide biosynthesis protein [Ilumatobacteraceae bacterium]
MADDALSGLGRRSALGLAGAAISGVATIATLVVASHGLGKVPLGQFFVAISVFAIAQGLCSLGIEVGMQYWVPALEPDAARRLIRHNTVLVAIIGLLAAVVTFAIATPLSNLVGDADSGDATSVLRATAIVLPFAGLYEITLGALRACDRVVSAIVLDRFLRPVAQVVAMLAVAAADGGATSTAYAWALPNAGAVLVALVLIGRPNLTAKVHGGREVLSHTEFWHYTTPRAAARIAQVLTQRLDVLLIAAIGTVADAGVYGTVSRCMIAGVFVATAVQQMVQPRLRKLVVRGDLGAVKEMYGASTTWLVLTTWPAYLTMAIFAPLVLRAFGDDVVRGSKALTILCLAMLVASACGLVEVVLLMVGRSWLSTANVLAALAINIVMNIVLIPHIGMTGAAIAWMAAIFVTNLVPLYQVSRLGLHPGGTPLTTAMVVGLGAFSVPLLLCRLVAGPSVVSFCVGLAVGLPAYVAAVFVTRRRVLLDRFVSDLRPTHPPRVSVS